MKRWLLAAMICATFATTTSASEDPPRHHNALRKLGRGVANVLFGVVEVPNQYTKAVSKHGGAAGFTYGLPKGIVRWVGRELVGVFEIVTFPLPVPSGYRPIMQPEWPNEDYAP
ncbi:MAG: exosortase system-associated protein, TIGR04073 family [Verrucomicrobiae bacterium]|nr:exosortase system-associated protein, TIGR04073 family [Verrucomicrobiae bacterium]